MTKTKPITICLSPEYNVALALTDLTPGDLIANDTLICQDHVPVGHTVAVQRKAATIVTAFPFSLLNCFLLLATTS